MNVHKTIFLMAFLFCIGFSYEISLVSDSTVYAHESWVIDAFVEDLGVPVENPDCQIKITNSEETVVDTSMTSQSDRAHYKMVFYEIETYSVNVSCGGDSELTDVQIFPNSQLNVDTNSPGSLLENLQITADYESVGGDDIISGFCDATIYVDDDVKDTLSLYYNSVDSAFYTSTSISFSGNYKVKVTCSDGDYSQLSESDYFSVSKPDVIVNLKESSISGYYNTQIYNTISIYPYDSQCTSDYGTLYETSSNSYSFQYLLDFIGSDTITVTCSAPGYSSKTKSFKISSRPVPTRLSVVASPENPFSFQTYYLTPSFYDKFENRISDASCSVDVDGLVQTISSFTPATIQALAGPSEQKLKISCSKTGYESSEITAVMNVRPITLLGKLTYPKNAKQNEPFDIEISLIPGIEANCEILGKITSRTGVLQGKIEEAATISGKGKLTVKTELSGDLGFKVSCDASGYSTFEELGDIKVTVLSSSEEANATIILTILTLLLAVGFFLVRRYF